MAGGFTLESGKNQPKNKQTNKQATKKENNNNNNNKTKPKQKTKTKRKMIFGAWNMGTLLDGTLPDGDASLRPERRIALIYILLSILKMHHNNPNLAD